MGGFEETEKDTLLKLGRLVSGSTCFLRKVIL